MCKVSTAMAQAIEKARPHSDYGLSAIAHMYCNHICTEHADHNGVREGVKRYELYTFADKSQLLILNPINLSTGFRDLNGKLHFYHEPQEVVNFPKGNFKESFLDYLA